ncbi:MAG TPA: DUF190 domain-containing protein [Candidatus Binatia bacterium]|nr:DUF190 domain-containing protein [Candidatus Binatia bacterium]
MRGKRMTVFLDETDQWHHRALYLAILDRLKAAGCAGATAVRGIAGFGPHSHIIKTARFVDVRMDLPMVITVIDLPDRIERFAAEVAGMLSGGAIVLEDVEVHFYSAGFRGGLPDVTVADVMSRAPEFVTPDTPLVEVVRRLLERGYTVMPVVDSDRRVVGVIGDQDLLSRGIISERLHIHRAAAEVPHDTLQRLASNGGMVRDVMTAPAVTVHESTHVPEAARLMHDRRLKRLPVIDDAGRLVGVLGRFDILSSIASGYARRTAPRSAQLPQEHRTVGEIMERDVPTVAETAPLGDVIERLLDSTVHEVIVVDPERRPVGIITTANVLVRADPAERPGLLTQLRSRWSAEARRQVRRTYGQRAGDVMASRVVTVRDTDPVITALTLSATKHLKRPPVVDAQGKLVGVVGRPALLAASLDLRIGNART